LLALPKRKGNKAGKATEDYERDQPVGEYSSVIFLSASVGGLFI
jgi:hypothetical protein